MCKKSLIDNDYSVVYYIDRKGGGAVDIGGKIKSARISANLTQEQVADFLNVSRQTISNWENGKAYPDIVSVVKMSDLYGISLDYLLKEGKPMSNYLNYLEESTNAVKSKNKLSAVILIAVYLGIWTISLLSFWLFNSGSDALGYSIMYLWILLPVTMFVVSFIIGINNYWGRKKWFITIGLGIMYMLAEYGTFSAANMISFGKINLPEFIMIPMGAGISLLGMGMGTGFKYWVHFRGDNNG